MSGLPNEGLRATLRQELLTFGELAEGLNPHVNDLQAARQLYLSIVAQNIDSSTTISPAKNTFSKYAERGWESEPEICRQLVQGRLPEIYRDPRLQLSNTAFSQYPIVEMVEFGTDPHLQFPLLEAVQHPDVKFYEIEVDPNKVTHAKKVAASLGMSDQIEIIEADFLIKDQIIPALEHHLTRNVPRAWRRGLDLQHETDDDMIISFNHMLKFAKKGEPVLIDDLQIGGGLNDGGWAAIPQSENDPAGAAVNQFIARVTDSVWTQRGLHPWGSREELETAVLKNSQNRLKIIDSFRVDPEVGTFTGIEGRAGTVVELILMLMLKKNLELPEERGLPAAVGIIKAANAIAKKEAVIHFPPVLCVQAEVV